MHTISVKSEHLGGSRQYADEGISISKAALARTILYFTYIIVPIAAGADKFFNILVDWKKYLNPLVMNILPVQPGVFMMAVGIIEIAAGILLMIKPKIGAYVVSLWLV